MSFLLFAIVLLAVFSDAQAGFQTFTYGGRANKLYIPNNYNPSSKPKGYPLFVMLHGCTQDPDTFATGTKMNHYAEQFGFFVLYPLQPSTANSNKCWNWFDAKHQTRNAGEPLFIAGATNSIASSYAIDKEAIFCAGLSAGGAMTAIMGALYPDVYTSLGIGAGLEFKAATSVLSAYTAMINGGPAPRTQGAQAFSVMKNYIKWPIEVLVVQGTTDYTVYPINGQQATEQWITANNLFLGGGQDTGRIPLQPTTTTPGTVPSGHKYEDNCYADKETGVCLVHYIKVTSMGHAWSGGNSAGSYADPKGPDASLYMVNWFLQYDQTLLQSNRTHILSAN